MGRIFTYDEVASGQIPQFALAKSLLFEGLPKISGFIGAKIYGSVGLGTPNKRSDLDMILVVEGQSVQDEVDNLARSITDKTAVHFELTQILRKLAEVGLHSIDCSFYANIASIPEEGNIIGQNPLEILTVEQNSLIAINKGYLNAKIKKLGESCRAQTEADKYKGLQRALEVPVNAGRRVLQTLNDFDPSIPFKQEDGKIEVVRNFRHTFFGLPHILNSFELLLAMDTEYSAYLEHSLRETPSKEDYDEVVSRLFLECVPLARDWTEELCFWFGKTIEGSEKNIEGQSLYRGTERLV